MSPAKRFSVATGTAPDADHVADVQTPRRQDVSTTARARPTRTAFTWRLTPQQAIALDDMLLRLRRELDLARLDRATMLAALVELTASNGAIFGALAAKLQESQTS